MFTFKQFTINQDQCAMKVSTDGVLLGAWAPIEHKPNSILDIGTGTGLLALMLAQRCPESQIDAFDIDDNAFEQASHNFLLSPWADRLYCYHAGLDEFIDEPEQTYELIVCNPPFHTESQVPINLARQIARSAHALPLEMLAKAAGLLLAKEGVFAVIVPVKVEEQLIGLMSTQQLFPCKITRVQGTAKTPIKRSLLAFSASKIAVIPQVLVIEVTRHSYTPAFTDLMKEFYLHL